MGLLPFLVAFGGYVIEKYFRPRYLYVSAMAVITVFSLFSLPYVLPVLSFKSLEKYAAKTGSWVSAPFIRWEDGKQHQVSQVYADMTGWKELANMVEKAYNNLTPEEKNQCTIFCQRNYGYAGAINFYGHKYNLPDAVTFLESYIFWAPDTISDGPFIYIFYNSDEMKPYFNEITETGSIENPYFREKGLKVFLCKSPTADIKKIYAELALKEKSKFQRSN